MSRKKLAIIIGVVVLAAALTGGVWAFQTGLLGKKDNGDRVYVQTVSDIMNQNTGAFDRYPAVVESQESWDLNVDPDRTVKEVYVKVGDKVKKGTPLLEYDVDELQEQLEQSKLDLEGKNNDITSTNTEIAELTKERDAAPEDSKFEYTAQIQEKQSEIRQIEREKKTTENDIEKAQKQIENSVVNSKIDGVIKTLNNTDSMEGDGAFLTVLAVGKFRVKGTANELNYQNLTKGEPMILHSRTDDSLTWTGTIKKVDTSNPISSSDDEDMMYGGGDSGEDNSASKYPFYITLDNMDGLILGQHLYAELDMGQSTEQKEGIWLFSTYIVQEDGKDPYVWADNGKGELEKKTIKLGDYDENLDEYEIKSGLTEKTLIACPMKGLYEGVKTVDSAEKVDYNSPLYSDMYGSDGGEAEDWGDEDWSTMDFSGEEENIDYSGDPEVVPDDEMPQEMLDNIDEGDVVGKATGVN
ncbi:MAG: efflux RND transporter periplasmic adaptor subunit [Lachnospiraceae bacterium]